MTTKPTAQGTGAPAKTDPVASPPLPAGSVVPFAREGRILGARPWRIEPTPSNPTFASILDRDGHSVAKTSIGIAHMIVESVNSYSAHVATGAFQARAMMRVDHILAGMEKTAKVKKARRLLIDALGLSEELPGNGEDEE